MTYVVTLEACVAGNPLKAWIGTTGKDDTEHVPDDVWETLRYEFPDLDAAKAWIATLPAETTTHVELAVDGVPIYREDAGGAGYEYPAQVDYDDGRGLVDEVHWEPTGDLASAHVRTPEEIAAADAEREARVPGVVVIPDAPPLLVPPPNAPPLAKEPQV